MKCSECFKKKEKLFCKACSLPSPVILSKKLSLTQKIQIVKESLEEKVSHTLHFYFASQELKEKQVKIQHYKNILANRKAKKQDQLKIFHSLSQKKTEKTTNIQQLSEIKGKFLQEISKNKEILSKCEGKIQHLRKKLKKIQSLKVFYYNSILEINSIYPHWTIYKEFIIEKESGFLPIDEEDIEASISSIDDIDFEEIQEDNDKPIAYKIELVKPYDRLNEIYGQIIAFSLNQLAKIILYTSKIYGVFLPLNMKIEGNQVKISNSAQDQQFYQIKNVFGKKNLKNSEKFFILLLVNFVFLLKSFGKRQDLVKQGFIDWRNFFEFLINDGEKETKNQKPDIYLNFKLTKIKYYMNSAGSSEKLIEKNYDFYDESTIFLKEETLIDEDKQLSPIIESKNNESFEILENLNDIDFEE